MSVVTGAHCSPPAASARATRVSRFPYDFPKGDAMLPRSASPQLVPRLAINLTRGEFTVSPPPSFYASPPHNEMRQATRAVPMSTTARTRTLQLPPSPPPQFKYLVPSGPAIQRVPTPRLSTPRSMQPLTPRREENLGPCFPLVDLVVGGQPFDPCHPSIKPKLTGALGVEAQVVIESLGGVAGFCNDGLWSVRGAQDELVLKLVKVKPVLPGMPTEAENYRKIWAQHPSIVDDPCIAFPQRIIRIFSEQHIHVHDLIVMKKVVGTTLGDVITKGWKNETASVCDILERVGSSLAEFHKRYGMQHCDVQPSNVIVDESNRRIFLIDLGGMSFPTHLNDVDYFTCSLQKRAARVGEDLAKLGAECFRRGYDRRTCEICPCQ